VTREPLFSMPLVANPIRPRFGRRLQYAQFLNSSNAATMRTVQDIVNNLLNGLQLVQLEAEGEPAEMQSQVDGVIQEATTKLRALGDLETIKEKEMAVGLGIDYPEAAF
jgi:hypothetical protein